MHFSLFPYYPAVVSGGRREGGFELYAITKSTSLQIHNGKREAELGSFLASIITSPTKILPLTKHLLPPTWTTEEKSPSGITTSIQYPETFE